MMIQERSFNVIIGPQVSEKSTRVAEKFNQVVFKVIKDATKHEIKKAVEAMFSVKVEHVTTLNVKGKTRNFRQIAGQRKSWKKAYVSLAEGQDIDFAGKE
jgi:large subunit ribosomal protein L23